MDFKFARLQDVHVKFNGLEWNKMLCRLNQYHMKTILVLLFIGSFSFILIQNSPVGRFYPYFASFKYVFLDTQYLFKLFTR